MLIQFSFKNFKSFRDEATLDLSATKISEFNERVVNVGKERVLPVAAIYGANASGKSNVFGAFEYMSLYVIRSLYYADDPEAFANYRPMPFLFDDQSKNAESSFEVFFTIPDDNSCKIYNYGFCIGNEGITEEWLNFKYKTSDKYRNVFYRSLKEKTLELDGLSDSEKSNISTALEKQVLIISLGAKLRVDICKLVYDWFRTNQIADFASVIPNIVFTRRLSRDFLSDNNYQEKIVKFISSFDESIQGFHVEEIPSEDEERTYSNYKINTIHKTIGNNNVTEIPITMESAGTLKMITLFPKLQAILKSGGVFFVDELNARLHPLLLRNVVLTFLNPKLNHSHAQLVFTTHDAWLLSQDFFRRDEIWFVEKDVNGLSTLYSLADFVDEDGVKIRKDESYEKNYLLGKYGAIPDLKTIDILRGN